MEYENIQNEIITNEIGQIARILDTEMTMFERMRVKKKSLKKIFGALMFYTAVMILFIFVL